VHHHNYYYHYFLHIIFFSSSSHIHHHLFHWRYRERLTVTVMINLTVNYTTLTVSSCSILFHAIVLANCIAPILHEAEIRHPLRNLHHPQSRNISHLYCPNSLYVGINTSSLKKRASEVLFRRSSRNSILYPAYPPLSTRDYTSSWTPVCCYY
jgi:hypothetical protein